MSTAGNWAEGRSTSGTVAVFGATGQQGESVVDALLSQGAAVRALVRSTDSERARALAERGVELARMDTADDASLRAALSGADRLFFMTRPAGPDLAAIESETQLGVALVDAAVAAGVASAVYSSVGGAERDSGVPHFESKRRIEQHLEQVDLPATIVRPAAFMDNFHVSGPLVENGQLVLRMPMPDGIALQMIAVRDIGRISATLLLDNQHATYALEIAGDSLTGSAIASAFGAHLGLPSRYEALPLDVLDGDSDTQAMFRWFAETPAYQADIDAVRAVEPTLWDLPTWLRTTNWAPAH